MRRMRQMIRIALVTCMLFPAVARAQVDTVASTASERQIQSIMNEQMRAANAHDTDRFMASYLHDASLVFVFNGVVYNGWDSLHAQQLKWWSDGKSGVVYSQRGPTEFTVLGPDAVVAMSPLQSRRTLANGEVSAGEFTVTAVWQKRPDGWKIVQGHESTVH